MPTTQPAFTPTNHRSTPRTFVRPTVVPMTRAQFLAAKAAR